MKPGLVISTNNDSAHSVFEKSKSGQHLYSKLFAKYRATPPLVLSLMAVQIKLYPELSA